MHKSRNFLKNTDILPLTWVGSMVCELYLNKAKKKNQAWIQAIFLSHSFFEKETLFGKNFRVTKSCTIYQSLIFCLFLRSSSISFEPMYSYFWSLNFRLRCLVGALGNVWRHLEGSCYWHQWVEAWDTVKHPTTQGRPSSKDLPGPNCWQCQDWEHCCMLLVYLPKREIMWSGQTEWGFHSQIRLWQHGVYASHMIYLLVSQLVLPP